MIFEYILSHIMLVLAFPIDSGKFEPVAGCGFVSEI